MGNARWEMRQSKRKQSQDKIPQDNHKAYKDNNWNDKDNNKHAWMNHSKPKADHKPKHEKLMLLTREISL